MEMWQGTQYHDLIAIPTTRRRRLVQRKIDLERKRKQQHDQEMARARTRRR